MKDLQCDELFLRAFEEDFARNDITTLSCIDDTEAEGIIVSKQAGCIAGLIFLPRLFSLLKEGIECRLLVNDGTICNKRTEIACINGPARALLSGERTALNLLQHLSGVATLTAQCVEKVKGTKCQILDTRKTVPGLRLLDKYAVRVGGGTNHRLHLGDRILIKNNHLALSKSIGVCIERAKKAYPLQWVEVEVDNLSELEEAIEAGADGALLDNMQPEEVARCVELAQGRLFLEASGGISLENVLEYAKTGVDGVSIGALTHSAPALDISMKIRSKS